MIRSGVFVVTNEHERVHDDHNAVCDFVEGIGNHSGEAATRSLAEISQLKSCLYFSSADSFSVDIETHNQAFFTKIHGEEQAYYFAKADNSHFLSLKFP